MDKESIRAFRKALSKLSQDKSLPLPQLQSSSVGVTVRLNSENFDMYVIQKSQLTEMGLSSMKYIVDLRTPFITVHVPGDNSLLSKLTVPLKYRNPSYIPSAKMRKKSEVCNSYRNEENDSVFVQETDALVGSPLKLQTIADFSCFDSPATPTIIEGAEANEQSSAMQIMSSFNITKARMFASLYNLAVNGRDIGASRLTNPLPMWILCNGQHMKPYVLIGNEKLQENENAWKSTIVTLQELLPKNECQFSILNKSSLVGKQVTCRSIYTICSFGTECEVEERKFSYQGFVQAELKWDKSSSPTVTLLHKPPGDAESIVRASVASGDMRSGIYMLYRELDLLKSFINSVESGEISWVVEKGDVPLIEEIKLLLEQLKLGSANTSAASNNMENCEGNEDDEFPSKLAPLIIEERVDKDFTDRLWDVLINCTSHSELLQCLKHVLKELSSGELQPFIHMSNHTTLAQMVRDSYTGRLTVPHLTGVFPLQLLAEIGIKKLVLDYTHAFVSKDMTTIASLQYFISQNLELSEKLMRLEKLHNVLEMVAMLKIYLNLPSSALGICARQMLQYYEQNCIDVSHIFQFSVKTSAIIKRISVCPPWIWKAELSRQIGNSEKERYVYCLTRDQPFFHLSLPKLPEFDMTNKDDNLVGYYLIKSEENVHL